MKTLCYSVRLESLVSISDKAYLAKCFDGSSDIIPKSQVFGFDTQTQKSDAYWISAWILQKKNLQYSGKKARYFEKPNVMLDSVEISKHKAVKMEPVKDNIINNLKK